MLSNKQFFIILSLENKSNYFLKNYPLTLFLRYSLIYETYAVKQEKSNSITFFDQPLSLRPFPPADKPECVISRQDEGSGTNGASIVLLCVADANPSLVSCRRVLSADEKQSVLFNLELLITSNVSIHG